MFQIPLNNSKNTFFIILDQYYIHGYQRSMTRGCTYNSYGTACVHNTYGDSTTNNCNKTCSTDGCNLGKLTRFLVGDEKTAKSK